MGKVVVDDWGQCANGQLGALRPHVEAGRLTRETLHAELCEIVVGQAPGRESLARGSCSGIADCHCRTSHWPHALLEQAEREGVGTSLRFA